MWKIDCSLFGHVHGRSVTVPALTVARKYRGTASAPRPDVLGNCC